MDWQTLLWLGGLVALFFIMMRGCGGMAGGCGMGSRRRDTSAKSSDAAADADDRTDRHHAA